MIYKWFKSRKRGNEYTQEYEYYCTSFLKKIAYEPLESAKKRIYFGMALYGFVDLFVTGVFISYFQNLNQPKLFLYPALVFSFGIYGYAPQSSYSISNKKLNSILLTLLIVGLGFSLLLVGIYWSCKEYFTKKSIPFDNTFWINASTVLGLGLLCISTLIFILKILNWVQYKFSNLFTIGCKRYAQYCLNTNKEVPISILTADLALAGPLILLIYNLFFE